MSDMRTLASLFIVFRKVVPDASGVNTVFLRESWPMLEQAVRNMTQKTSDSSIRQRFNYFCITSRCVDSRPRVDLYRQCRCAVLVCCHLANRLTLTVRENERKIAHYIIDFHKLYNHLQRTRREKRGAHCHP